MTADEFRLLIKKMFVDDLLKPYNPQMSWKHEYVKGPYAGYEIGVEVRSFRLMFVYEEPGGAGVMVGSPSSRFENTANGWFDLDRAIAFSLKKLFLWDDPYKGMSYDARIEAIFSATANNFSKSIDQIIDKFRSQSRVLEWESEYRSYEKDQVRLRYPDLLK